jgi:predicted ABC-type ATPase
MPFVLMIAGPNGSGKTTLTKKMRAGGVDFGVYINPDDIALTLTGDYPARVAQAQIEADRLRDECLKEGRSFSFETVMSHPSKIELLKQAKALGFDALLYFVSTANPRINVRRVAQRVAEGGHDVPVDRIIDRYERTMAMLPAAILAADVARLFDNTELKGASETTAIRLVASARKNENGLVDLLCYAPTPYWLAHMCKDNAGKFMVYGLTSN